MSNYVTQNHDLYIKVVQMVLELHGTREIVKKLKVSRGNIDIFIQRAKQNGLIPEDFDRSKERAKMRNRSIGEYAQKHGIKKAAALYGLSQSTVIYHMGKLNEIPKDTSPKSHQYLRELERAKKIIPEYESEVCKLVRLEKDSSQIKELTSCPKYVIKIIVQKHFGNQKWLEINQKKKEAYKPKDEEPKSIWDIVPHTTLRKNSNKNKYRP